MNDIERLVKYRIDRADTAFRMAKVAAVENEWNLVCNRLYYAVFYMLSAYLASVNSDNKTHNGTRIKFHAIFVKTQRLRREDGELYDLLFSNRQDADYSDFLILKKEEIFPLIEETNKLLELIKSFIKV